MTTNYSLIWNTLSFKIWSNKISTQITRALNHTTTRGYFIVIMLISPLSQTRTICQVWHEMKYLFVFQSKISIQTGPILWFLTKPKLLTQHSLSPKRLYIQITRELHKYLTGHIRQSNITIMFKIDIYILALCQVNGCLNL